MTTYKGFNIWHNDLQNTWMVQTGYDVLGAYATLQGAKCSITTKWMGEYF